MSPVAMATPVFLPPDNPFSCVFSTTIGRDTPA